MTPQQLMTVAKRAGDAAARAVFAKRSNQVEVHLSEAMLAGLCALAAELALKETLPAEVQATLPVVLADEHANTRRFQVVNTWNGGAGGRRVQFVSPSVGDVGYNECFEWFHKNTSFSFSEATTNQGYHVEAVRP